MQSFKQHLLYELFSKKPIENEAMLVLQKVIDMADDGHVDYGTDKIKLNVGKLIKNKKYNNLDIYIVKGKDGVKIGRHSSENRHAIFISTPRLPKRQNIDTFLSDAQRSSGFKSAFLKFFNDATFDETDEDAGSSYEQTNELNTRPAFEKSYVELVNNLNAKLGQYFDAKKELEDRIERASDDLGHKEVIKLSLDKLKKEMVGGNVNEFMSKAVEVYGKDKYKMLDKDFKAKLESRLKDYYEHKVS